MFATLDLDREGHEQECAASAKKKPTFFFSATPLQGLTDFRITKYGM